MSEASGSVLGTQASSEPSRPVVFAFRKSTLLSISGENVSKVLTDPWSLEALRKCSKKPSSLRAPGIPSQRAGV